jgi:hypothetical protein
MLGGFDPFIPFVVAWCLATSALVLLFAAQHAFASRRRCVVACIARQERWTRRSVSLTTAECETDFRHSEEFGRLRHATGDDPLLIAIYRDQS